MSTSIPEEIKQLFAGDAVMTDSEVSQFMNWLMMNYGERVFIPDYGGEFNDLWDLVSGYIGDDVVKFIFEQHINKIKPSFSAIIKKNGPYIDNIWWDYIVKAGVDAIDFVADAKVSFKHFELDFNVMVSHLPELAKMMSKNATYNLDGELVSVNHRGDYHMKDIIEALVTSYNNATGPLKSIIVSQSAEIAELRAEIAELRLRPPELGGPDYEAAKSHFDGEKSTW